MMNTQAQSSGSQHHQPAHRHAMSIRPRQERSRVRHEPLTDEQFVASSLALVAHLSLRMRAQSHHQA